MICHPKIQYALMLAMVAGLGVAARLTAADSKNDDPLAGTWEQTSAERDGVRKAPAKPIKATVTFDEGSAKFRTEQEADDGKLNMEIVDMKYVVDSSKTPHEVDFITVREGKEVRILGIFKRDKDQLVLALDSHESRGQRPREFATKKGDGFDLISMKKIKKDEKKEEAVEKAIEAKSK